MLQGGGALGAYQAGVFEALHEAVPVLLRIADEHRSELVRLSTRAATLDDVFLSLTGHGADSPIIAPLHLRVRV